MAGERQQNVTITWTQEGISQMVAGMQGMQQQMTQMLGSFKSLNKIQEDHEDVTKKKLLPSLDALKNAFQGLRQQFREGEVAAAAQGASLGLLETAFRAATSPAGLFALTLGGVTFGLKHMTDIAMGAYNELKNLQSMTGMTVRESQVLMHTLQLAGVDTDRVTRLLMRMSTEMESGGRAIRGMGIDLRSFTNEGEALWLVIDKIQRMPDPMLQLRAMRDLVGRREALALIPIMRANPAEFAELRKQAEHTASATDELMVKMRRYARTLKEIEHGWESIKTRIAESFAVPLWQSFMERNLYLVQRLADTVANLTSRTKEMSLEGLTAEKLRLENKILAPQSKITGFLRNMFDVGDQESIAEAKKKLEAVNAAITAIQDRNMSDRDKVRKEREEREKAEKRNADLDYNRGLIQIAEQKVRMDAAYVESSKRSA